MLFINTQKVLYILFIIFILLLPALIPSKVYAHVLETDGSIGVIMHIDPDDDPIGGEQSTFYFEFKDKENKMKLSECDCAIEIYNNEVKIFSSQLSNASKHAHASGQSSENSTSLTFTFPAKGIYTMRLLGRPIEGLETFRPFKIEDSIRVEREPLNLKPEDKSPDNDSHTTHSSSKNTVHIFIFLITITSFIIFTLKRKESLD